MRINWAGNNFNPYSGYGRMGAYFIRELCAPGVEVSPVLVESIESPHWLRQQLAPRFDTDSITISLMNGDHIPKVEGRQWGFTMYEDTGVPPGWAENINEACERLLVLCEHNADSFKKAGVTVPIHIVYGGTDPNEFPYVPHEDRPDRPYTFVCLADRGARKGIEVSYMAFFEAFEGVDDVHLLIKSRKAGWLGVSSDSFTDPRVTVWKEDVESMREVYAKGDCFVFPSYGEGWGMPPREAAMMGLPVIATNWSGLAVGNKQWSISINDYTLQPSLLKSRNAKWAVPNIRAVAEKMRFCYENQEAARLIGFRSSEWLRKHQTWAHSARQLMGLLEDYS